MKSDLLAQRELVDRYLKEVGQSLSSFSFVNLFVWKDFFDFEFKSINGNLCVFASDQAGTFLYLPPLGKSLTPAVIEECFSIMNQRNKGRGVSRIENVPVSLLNVFPEPKFKLFSKGDEYCYYRKAIVELQGNAYKSKRNDYNYFTKYYQPEYGVFTAVDSQECLALYDRWAAERKKETCDDAYLFMLEDNRQVHAAVFNHYLDLGVTGRVTRVEGRITAYTFGYAVTKDMFCVLCEIADTGKKGNAVYIFSQFCDDREWAGYKFVNVMDDFALENIQKAKMSFHPTMLLSSTTVSQNS